MAVVVGRMVAILEAQTAAFEARMGAAAQQMNRMTNTAASARRGMTDLRSGLEQLAFSGLGLLPPAAARAGAALTTVFVGAPWMLAITAAAAAIGALGMAFDHAGKKAQEFVEQAQRSRDLRMRQLEGFRGIGPDFRMTPDEELALLQRQRAAIQDLIRQRQETVAGSFFSQVQLLTPGGQAVTDPVAQRAQQDIDALSESLRNLNRAIRDITFEPFRRQFAEFALDLETRTLPAELLFRARRAGGVAFPTFGGAAAGAGVQVPHFLPRDPFAGIAKVFGTGKATDQPKRGGFQVTPELAQMLLFSMMSLRGGGAGGALMALGGLSTGLAGVKGIAGKAAAGPLGWIGVGFTALGALIGTNADKNAEKVVKAIERMGKQIGLERITLVFSGPDGHEIRRRLTELEESDGVDRMPGPAGD